MADDYPTPPQPTLVSGTGSAVQTATDPEGNKWQFDNDKGNWVNLNTGESVSPETFSQMAGRSGNAARDTIALSQAMRREEASLVPPRPMPAPTQAAAPAPPPMPAAAPVAPPVTQTATQTPFSPVMRPGAEGVLPPYTASERVRVRNQRPVPSMQIPPSPGAERFYQMQQVDWLMRNRGMKPAEAMRMVGIEPGMNAYQQANVLLRQRQLDQQKDIAQQRIQQQMTSAITPYTATYGDQQFVVNPKTGGVHPLKSDAPPVVVGHIKSLEKTVSDWDKTISQDPKNKLVEEWKKRRDAAQSEWERIYNQFAPEGARTSAVTPLISPRVPPSLLPKNKSEMIKGKHYSAKGRIWEWDGKQLVAVE